MALQYSTTLRNAQLDAIESTVGASAVLKIRSGGAPANVAAADSGTVLATFSLPSDWMAAASNGTKGKSGTEIEPFKWLNVILGNLKTSLTGTYHAFKFRKYAARYLADVQYRFNRRSDLVAMLPRLAVAVMRAKPCSRKTLLSVAEVGT